MAFTLPADPADGDVAPASWGDAVRAALSYLGNPPSCRVYHSVNQSIADATETSVVFNSERWDTAGMHSTSTNTNRITVPDAGLYLCTFRGNLQAAGDYAAAYAALRLSSGTVIDKDQRLPSAFIEGAFHISTVYKMAAGDWVEIRVYHDNSANAARNLVGSGQYSPEFSATWIGLG